MPVRKSCLKLLPRQIRKSFLVQVDIRYQVAESVHLPSSYIIDICPTLSLFFSRIKFLLVTGLKKIMVVFPYSKQI